MSRYEICVINKIWERLEPSVIIDIDPRPYLGDNFTLCAHKVRSYYYNGQGYVLVWDLKHKNYEALINCIGT
jgi:hypothetical protein